MAEQTIRERVATVEAQHANFTKWQEDQNGTLKRLEEKLDGLKESIAKAFSGWNKVAMGGLWAVILLLLGALISLKFGVTMAAMSP